MNKDIVLQTFQLTKKFKNITAVIEGLGTFYSISPSVYFPVCAHPLHNQIEVTAYNNDMDRGYKDQESSTITATDDLILTDDDTTPPSISITHNKLGNFGVGYDNDPGYWTVSAVDPESGIGSINVQIDGIYAGSYLGVYNVPNTPGDHHISAIIANGDNDYPADLGVIDIEVSLATHWITIQDDDTIPPYINIYHYGGATDFDPGYWTVSTSDVSGISSMSVYIDDILVGTADGTYYVPDALGLHTIRVVATDADNDRLGDSLTRIVSTSVTVVDDDPNMLGLFGGLSPIRM